MSWEESRGGDASALGYIGICFHFIYPVLGSFQVGGHYTPTPTHSVNKRTRFHCKCFHFKVETGIVAAPSVEAPLFMATHTQDSLMIQYNVISRDARHPFPEMGLVLMAVTDWSAGMCYVSLWYFAPDTQPSSTLHG